MKKSISLMLVLVILISAMLTGCVKEEMVPLVLPISLFAQGVEDFNEADYLSKNEGVDSVKINEEDETITIKLTKREHKKMVESQKVVIEESFEDLIGSEYTPYIRDIKSTKNFEKVTIFVDKDEYKKSLDMTPLLVQVLVRVYQLFSGERHDLTILIEDFATGEEIYLETFDS